MSIISSTFFRLLIVVTSLVYQNAETEEELTERAKACKRIIIEYIHMFAEKTDKNNNNGCYYAMGVCTKDGSLEDNAIYCSSISEPSVHGPGTSLLNLPWECGHGDTGEIKITAYELGLVRDAVRKPFAVLCTGPNAVYSTKLSAIKTTELSKKISEEIEGKQVSVKSPFDIQKLVDLIAKKIGSDVLTPCKTALRKSPTVTVGCGDKKEPETTVVECKQNSKQKITADALAKAYATDANIARADVIEKVGSATASLLCYFGNKYATKPLTAEEMKKGLSKAGRFWEN